MYPTKKEEKMKDQRGLHNYIHYEGPLEDAVNIARHFGFNLVEPITFSRRLPNTLTDNQKEKARKKDLRGFPPGKMAVLKKYFDENMDKMPQPIMLTHISEGDEPGTQEFRLDVLGTKKSLAEALILKAGAAILDNWGHKNLAVHLNSLGDRECSETFHRELHEHYRKNLNDLAGCCRQQMKKALMGVLECSNEKCSLIKEKAPKPVNFLTESSRRHLAEIIEYIENIDLPYRINDHLVGNHVCFPKTVFHIKEELENGEDVDLARGERHDYLSKEIGISKKIPLVSLAISLKTDQRRKERYVPKNNNIEHPKVYFAHIGYDARLKSLKVMDVLREAKIPVKYMVGLDSISKQLRQAEADNASFVMILGQKEVLDNTVIWRDMDTRYQESVPISRLKEYISSLRKAKLL